MASEQKINEQIKSREVNLVTPEGDFRTGISLQEALKQAEDFGLDLVEVSPSKNGKLSVCKILDYGKLRYQKSKKRKSEKKIAIKDIKFGLNISDHDLEVKNNKVKNIISKGNKVRYILELKGREASQIDTAVEKIKAGLAEFSDLANCSEVKKSGRFVSSLISSLEK
tara:strand:+ start:31655 stop:32158 length:504 start_codon:yes stop_codon:yes gene_type:complete